MSSYAPVGGRLVTPVTVVLGGLFGISVFLLVIRFINGLGAVSNLNDGYTWGIWVVVDIVIGTAFACGGYAMALLVYVFNKGQYHSLVRPALLASMFGYTLGGLAVLFDLGRWWNFWHLISPAYFNVNSVMFEVGACVFLYVIVMWIEFLPAFLEKLGINRLRQKLNKMMFLFIALGILLPTMHQSSLGTMMVVFGRMIDPLWQTNMLPLLFVLSAYTMGLSVVIFEASISAEGFKRQRETRLLGQMSTVIVGLILIYLAIRIGDIIARGELSRIYSNGFLSGMFLVEMALFLIPVLILLTKRARSSAALLFVAAVSMLLAGSLYRIDTMLVAFNPGSEYSYFPSIPEMLITIGIISFEILAYIVLAKYLPVLHQEKQAGATGELRSL
ncbi:MAG: Ni/Fe-hydrogenase cytochrome b subunit [Gammaproteobacteria bacterium]|nr:Ni/Fe-hydrogenase cytochrome b subunit [Gammaproteobacteria bacterium]